jgi:ketosteroid isomerase-like protein
MYRLFLLLSLVIMCAGTAARLVTDPSGDTAVARVGAATPPVVKSRQQVIAEITRAIDRLRELERTRDPAIIRELYADDLVTAMNGRLTVMTRERREALLESLDSEQLHDYRIINIKRPVIDMSDDGSIAWATVQQRRQEIDRRNGARLRTWDFVTLLVFRQTRAGSWQLVSMARSGADEAY